MKKIQITHIKAKLVLNALGVAFLLMVFGYVSYRYLERKKELESLNIAVNKLVLDVIDLRKDLYDFLLKEQNNREFFDTGNSHFKSLFKQHYHFANEHIMHVRNSQISDEYLLEPILKEIQEKAESYSLIFGELTDNVFEKGDGDHGMIGELINSTRKIENLISLYSDNLFIKEYLLELRREEKIFLARNDLEYRNSFVKEIESFKESLEGNLDSTYNKASILAEIELYREKFLDVIKKDQDIQGSINKAEAAATEIQQRTKELVERISENNQKAIRLSIWSLRGMIFTLIVIVLSAMFWIARSITNPINRIQSFIEELSRGKLPSNISLKSNDEIAQMAEALNLFVESLREKSLFSQKIGKGELMADFKPIGSEDMLGMALLEMRDSLKRAKNDEEARKEEDRKASWATEGVAKFNDILRQNYENIDQLAYHILSNLVDYLHANQGGLFILNDEKTDDRHLQLIASFAYNRKKRAEKRIELREGLVGACAVERKTVYLDNIPEEYINITSGLGGANPTNLIVVPLQREDVVYGVVELASFKTFEAFEIEFVEKIGESIASTLSSAKMNERTSRLLEQSRLQSEEMRAQEEEMRQNMEELQSTQEEAARREMEMRGLLEGLNSFFLVAEYDVAGHVRQINEEFLEVLGLPKERAVGKHHEDLIIDPTKDADYFEDFWKDLRNGEKRIEIHQVVISGRKVWLHELYKPILDINDNVAKILNIGVDVTELKLKEIELSSLLKSSQEKNRAMEQQEDQLRIHLQELEDVKKELQLKNDEIEQIRAHEKEEALIAQLKLTKQVEAEKEKLVTQIKELEIKLDSLDGSKG